MIPVKRFEPNRIYSDDSIIEIVNNNADSVEALMYEISLLQNQIQNLNSENYTLHNRIYMLEDDNRKLQETLESRLDDLNYRIQKMENGDV